MVPIHPLNSLDSKKSSAFLSAKYIVPVILLLLFSLLTLARNYNWFDELRVWGKVAVSSPTKARVQTRLAVAYYKDGDYEMAYEAAASALAIYNFYPDAHYVSGLVLWRRGDNKRAIEELRWALMLVERFSDNTGYASDIHNALGRAYGDGGNFDMAIKEFRLALTLDPYNTRAQLNMDLIKEVQSKSSTGTAP